MDWQHLMIYYKEQILACDFFIAETCGGYLTHPLTVLCKKSIHAIQIGKEIFSAKENQLAHTKNEKALARFDALASETAVKSTN